MNVVGDEEDDLRRAEMRREPRRPLANLDCSWGLADDVGGDQVLRLWTCEETRIYTTHHFLSTTSCIEVARTRRVLRTGK